MGKNYNFYIRSTKIYYSKYSNISKDNRLFVFIDEYQKITQFFIDLLWNETKIPKLLNKSLTDKCPKTFLSARILQCSAKQASGIIRSIKSRQANILKEIDTLNLKGHFKKARKLKKFHDKFNHSKPILKNIQPELDSRFVKIDFNQNTSFDGWITLSSLGFKNKICLPFNKHKHFNQLNSKGTLKSGIRLSKKYLIFMFDIPNPIKINEGKIIGVDIGLKTTLSISNGQQINKDKHGNTIESISEKLLRKKKGSKGFKKAQEHRKNYINWCSNQIDLTGVKQVNRENIVRMKEGKKYRGRMKKLIYWSYKSIFESLDNKVFLNGVHLRKLNPRYTSQRCSCCGWVQKRNRKGKRFKCKSCSFEHDADLNASWNISLDLESLDKKNCSLFNNRKGFYWLEKRDLGKYSS